MKIEKFLEKINYKIKYGKPYEEENLKTQLLYWIFFTNKTEKYHGQLLLSKINKNIYFIKYTKNETTYFYKNKNLNYESNVEKKITLKNIMEIIEDN